LFASLQNLCNPRMMISTLELFPFFLFKGVSSQIDPTGDERHQDHVKYDIISHRSLFRLMYWLRPRKVKKYPRKTISLVVDTISSVRTVAASSKGKYGMMS